MNSKPFKIGLGATIFAFAYTACAAAQDGPDPAAPAILVTAGNGGTIALPPAPQPTVLPRDLLVEQASYTVGPAAPVDEPAAPADAFVAFADRAEQSHAHN